MANVPKSAMRDRESGIGAKRVRKNPNRTPPGHGLADSLLQLTGQVMGLAGAAVNGSVAAATSLLPIGAKATRTLLKAGGLLRQMREAAGLSLDDVSSAVDLRDPELLALAERGKMALPFELICDSDGKLCRLFDVIRPQNLLGKQVMGVDRSTFLIDANGVLRNEWRKVRVTGHVEEVLEAAESLSNVTI